MLVGIFICTPIRGFWDATVKSTCVNCPIFFISNEVFAVVYDIVVSFYASVFCFFAAYVGAGESLN